MPKPYRNRAMRNLTSAGYSAARITGRAASKSAVDVFKWGASDRTGLNYALDAMPTMGFVDSVRYLFRHFLISAGVAVFTGVWAFILIAFILPYLIFGG